MRYATGLFLLFFVVHSYAMLTVINQVQQRELKRIAERIELEDEFINKFSQSSWSLKEFSCNSFPLPAINNDLKDMINFIDKRKGNKLFSSVFYMATVLSSEIQKKIVKHFFRDNDTCKKDACLCDNVEGKCTCQLKCLNNNCMCTFEEKRWKKFETSFFKKKSIGESLHSYSGAHELSLGKFAYTRLFFDLMNKHSMAYRYKIIFSDDRRSIVQFNDSDGNCVSPENTQLILDYVLTELFDLTKSDILAVINLQEPERLLGKKAMQRLVDLDGRYRYSMFRFFRSHENNNVSYRGKHTYHYYINNEVAFATLVGLVLTSFISIPALLIGASEGIKMLCQKNICDDIVSKNASCSRAIQVLENDCKSIVDSTEGISGESFIPDYALIIEKIKSDIKDPMQYGMFGEYMIYVLKTLSFVLPGWLTILCICEPHGKLRIERAIISWAFFVLNCAAGLWFSEYPEDWKYGLLFSVALSIGIGIGRGIYVYVYDDFTGDKIHTDSIKMLLKDKEIELLERKDIETI